MVQQLLPLLPHEIGRCALIAALTATLFGAVLWLVGARFSRPMITLVGVAAGAFFGRMLPGWMGWNVNTMAASVGGAVVLGMSGFLLHRMWVGLGLGVLLACWATVAVWVCFSDGAQLTWPPVDPTTTWRTFADALWLSVPLKVRQILPFAASLAMLSGLLASLLWPRFGAALLYSALGTSLLVGAGLIAIENGRPQWITIVPSQTWAQAMTLLGTVAFGAVVQWQLADGKKKKPEARSQEPA